MEQSVRENDKSKKRIFDIIQIGKKDDFVSRAFDIFIVIAILLNIAVLFLETFDSMEKYAHTLRSIELITIVIFLIEYVLRIWTSEYQWAASHRAVSTKWS